MPAFYLDDDYDPRNPYRNTRYWNAKATLWSPQMRKWMRTSERHGKMIFLNEGGGVIGKAVSSFKPSLQFNDKRNSMYLPISP